MNPRDSYAGFGPYKAPLAVRLVDWFDKAWPWLLSGVLIAGMVNAPRIVAFFSAGTL